MLLEIKNLSVEYFGREKNVSAIRNVSLSLNTGETFGIVGESGCGKSTLALSILRLIAPHEGKIMQGEIIFDGKNILDLSEEKMREIRGQKIAIIFQDPFSSLNPVIKIGKQVEEAIKCHQSQVTNSELKEKALFLIKQVRLLDPNRMYDSYPHQISGGQRQRVTIAMAIANHPKLLIADEPTTALDVTVQKEILELLCCLQRELEMAILFITHHMGIIANYTENLAVFYGGEVVEEGKTLEMIANPQHPYTQALLKALPSLQKHKMEKKKEGRLFMIPGAPPDLTQLPTGCIFHPRCPVKIDQCQKIVPLLRPLEKSKRKVSCHLAPFENGIQSS